MHVLNAHLEKIFACLRVRRKQLDLHLCTLAIAINAQYRQYANSSLQTASLLCPIKFI